MGLTITVTGLLPTGQLNMLICPVYLLPAVLKLGDVVTCRLFLKMISAASMELAFGLRYVLAMCMSLCIVIRYTCSVCIHNTNHACANFKMAHCVYKCDCVSNNWLDGISIQLRLTLGRVC